MLSSRLLTGPSSGFGLLGLGLTGAIRLGLAPPALPDVVGIPGGGGLAFLGAGELDFERERLRRSLERDFLRSGDFDLLRPVDFDLLRPVDFDLFLPVDLDLFRSVDLDFFRRSVERERLRSLDPDRFDLFLETLLDFLLFLERDRRSRERDLRFLDRERRDERDRLLFLIDLERDLRLLTDRDRDFFLFLDRDLDFLRLRERRPRDRDRLRLDRFRDRDLLFLDRDTERFFFAFETERSLADFRSTEDFFLGRSFDTERSPDSDLDLDRSPFFSSLTFLPPSLSPAEVVRFLSTLVDPFRRSLDRDLERPIFTLL